MSYQGAIYLDEANGAVELVAAEELDAADGGDDRSAEELVGFMTIPRYAPVMRTIVLEIVLRSIGLVLQD